MAIVTISRQVGSLGDEIAGLVADKLDYELIDREVIRTEALKCDADFKKVCSAYTEEIRPKGFFERLFFNDPGNTALFEALTYRLASRGDVVMIGRGTQFVLHHVPGVLKCRIVAPSEVRIERVARTRQVGHDQAARFVERYGKKRRALVEAIYHRDSDHFPNYDLVINTAVLTARDASDLIASAARRLGETVDTEERSRILNLLAFGKQVERAVKHAITSLSFRHVTVTAQADGKVVLEGVVADKDNRSTATRVARAVEGVTEVENRLRVAEMYF